MPRRITHPPPKLGIWLLEAVLSPRHDALIGDIEEEYADTLTSGKRGLANLRFFAQVIRTVPPIIINDFLWENRMFRNYLLVAVRNIRKHKGFSTVNIVGLALSMSVALLILTFIRDQGSFDSFHPNADRIYRITSQVNQPMAKYHMATSPAPLGPELVQQHSGVEAVVRMRRTGGILLHEGRSASFRGVFAEPTFFDFFAFPLRWGESSSALKNPFSIVLSYDLAQLLFGTQNPVGQIIQFQDSGDYEVTGVLDPLPSNTHLRVKAVVSFSTLPSLDQENAYWSLDSWTNNSQFYNYILLSPDTLPADVEDVAAALTGPHQVNDQYEPPKYRLQNVANVNLGKDLSNQIVSVMSREGAIAFSIMAIILMITAIFNYVSLSISRSLKRAKEIGIRKVVGAHRGQIIRQLMSESVLLSLLALVVAVALFFWLVPQFNALSFISRKGSTLELSTVVDPMLVLYFVLFAILVGLLAGLYPALSMSRFRPVHILKGVSRIGGFKRITLRKSLIVFQFSLSIIAVLNTITIFRQATMVMNADYGFDQEQLVQIRLSGIEYDLFKEEIMSIPGVTQVAAASSLPAGSSTTSTDIQTDEMAEPALIQHIAIDEQFIDQYRLETIAGRVFSPDNAKNDDHSLLLTESSLRYLGFDGPLDAIGTFLKFDTYTEEEPFEIVGIVSNIYARGFGNGYVPLALSRNPALIQHAIVRVAPASVQETLSAVEKTWIKISPSIPFSYAFFDDALRSRNEGLRDSIRMTGMFATLILIIACLGLLGMASYTTETRLNEIGIRKVLGADVRSVITLLSREYLNLIGIAVIIGTPIAYFLLDMALRNFANRIDLGPGLLLTGILPIVLIALATIGSQTFKAALTNPVETIHQE
ncbi:MAG: ABC transporter permease [Bacteroidetes bacterium]|nr:ABC transporter permease [Bacteroidota bacterium]